MPTSSAFTFSAGMNRRVSGRAALTSSPWSRAVPATASALPAGSALHSLLNDGIFAGLGAVLVFLPQILILFLFILILEESGYLRVFVRKTK